MKTIKAIALFLVIMVCSSHANSGVLPGFHPIRNHKWMALGVAAAIAVPKCMDDKGTMSKCIPKIHHGDDVSYESNEFNDDGPFVKSGDPQKLRIVLNIERVSSGMPPDPEGCEAHHIVPSEDSKGKEGYPKGARDILIGCKIDLNSVDNGVFLPGKREGSKCTGPYHRSLHSKKYYAPLYERLSNAAQVDCNEVLRELRSIKLDLMNGGI